MRSASAAIVLVPYIFVLGTAASASVPTFNQQVAPILFKNCARCHRPGGIAAIAPLLSYDLVRPWARAIKQKVLLREMPPWPADPTRSLKFRNDARLSRQDIETLVAWVNAGAPQGNGSIPPPPEFADGWLHPQGLKPDLVISMPGEFKAPATGDIPYVRFLARVPLTADKWVAAVQARPGNPALVHHMAITEVSLDEGVAPSGVDPFALLSRQLGFPNSVTGTQFAVTAPSDSSVFDMLGVYTPGSTLEMYGDDSAKLLKGGKNLYLNFNIHYQTTGRPETDRSMIAFWFRQGPPKHQLFRVPGAGETIIANGHELLTDAPGIKAEGTRMAIPPIPPFAANYELIGVTGFTGPVTIYQFHPHAHLRCKDFTYAVVYPDGREETVLSVPRYDFRWQLTYELETPLRLPAGSKLIVTAHYDNSRNNRYNPAPEKEVYFRDRNQSWDEMFTPFIQYTLDSQDLSRTPQPPNSERGLLQPAEVVGCLQQGAGTAWNLTNASDPVLSVYQPTTSLAVTAARARLLGDRQYKLLGVQVFSATEHRSQKVVVRGILIEDAKMSRLNVTSLQALAESCAQ